MSSNQQGRVAASLVAMLTVTLSGAARQPANRGGAPPEKLPPLSYVCPMPADAGVLEDKPGRCPKCGMTLQPIRLDLRYACPVHQTFIQERPGKHPYDGRELVPVTVSVFWTCGDEHFLEPGKCVDGSLRLEQYGQRAHGDHNPKHGGQFFMASDTWHHLEGTYPSAGLFRLYFYNDYSKPLTPTGFSATVSILDEQDREVVVNLPLQRGRATNTMEAAIPRTNRSMPIRLLAHVKFTATGRPNAFNFTFPEITKEPIAPPPAALTTSTRDQPTASPPTAATAPPASKTNVQAPASTPVPPAVNASAPPMVRPDASTQAATGVAAGAAPMGAQPFSADLSTLSEAVDENSLPKTVPALLAELTRRAAEVERLVQNGELGQVWLPAMGTKTVALALEPHVGTLAVPLRDIARSAAKRVVVAAWELDKYGDLGDKPKIGAAYRDLAMAVADLEGAYGPR